VAGGLAWLAQTLILLWLKLGRCNARCCALGALHLCTQPAGDPGVLKDLDEFEACEAHGVCGHGIEGLAVLEEHPHVLWVVRWVGEGDSRAAGWARIIAVRCWLE
jgi:hypothetical protein